MDTAKCTFCGKEFKKKAYLNRHLRTFHKTNAKGEPLSASPEEVQCVWCDKKFSRKYNLQQHINTVHFKQNSDIFKCPTCKYSSLNKSNLNRHIPKCRTNCGSEGTAEKNFQCSKCSANFKNKSSLRRHEQKNHKIRKQKNLMNRRKCPLCSFATCDRYKKSMYIHFENAHNISLKWENYSFGSLAEFYRWKRQMEKETVSSFFISEKHKNSITFQCHRCGIFKSGGKNMRRLKMAGTCKIDGFCPCSIKIKVKSDCVTALYQPIHVGHKNELKHIRLSKEERRFLALKLARKVPHEEILKNVRGSLSNSDLQRIHLINKKDLINIERDFNLNRKAILHPYDPVSIESWVLNLNESDDTALVLYKRQGEVPHKIRTEGKKFEEWSRHPEIDSTVHEIVLKETSLVDNNDEFEGKDEMLVTELDKLKELVEGGNCTTEQVDFMLKTIKQTAMTVEAMNLAGTIQASDSPENPGNTNVVKQRHFLAPLKTKRKKEILSKEEIQRISLDLLMEKQDMLLHSEINPIEPGTSREYTEHNYCKLIPAGEENMEL